MMNRNISLLHFRQRCREILKTKSNDFKDPLEVLSACLNYLKNGKIYSDEIYLMFVGTHPTAFKVESLDFLKEQGLSRLVTLQFVVQKNNFRDIPNFVQLLDKYDFNGNLTNLDDCVMTKNAFEKKQANVEVIKFSQILYGYI
jgi:hypothetical protein